SRYTVRGFDGEMSLIGDRGFYWRNELQAPIGNTGLSLYGGLDYGHVYGPSTVGLAGTQLAGAVIGLRGGWGTRAGSISYDLFLGTPVYKPAAFNTARITAGFQLVYQY
ncbi:ShlB/FhaC/HecB family hemolysin secretion/activation protein, partial [Ralstonia solanacearum]